MLEDLDCRREWLDTFAALGYVLLLFVLCKCGSPKIACVAF